MKKLVTLFTLAIAMVASADVASQNIVGYNTINFPQGFSLVTGTFAPVGGDGTQYRLGDLQPSETWDGNNGDTVQFYAADGSGLTSLTAWYYSGYGWCDFNNTDTMLDDQLVSANMGMYLEATAAAGSFLVAGQVPVDPLTVALPQGFTLIGNGLPRQITLGEIVPNANWDGNNGDTIQFYESDGSGLTALTAWYYSGYGWCDFNNTDTMLDDHVVASGVAVYLQATQSGSELEFPAAM